MCQVKYVIYPDINEQVNMATKCQVNPEALLRALHIMFFLVNLIGQKVWVV